MALEVGIGEGWMGFEGDGEGVEAELGQGGKVEGMRSRVRAGARVTE